MPVVNIEGVGEVHFPDSMSQEEIGLESQKLYDSARPAAASPAAPAGISTPEQIAPTETAPKRGTSNEVLEQERRREASRGEGMGLVADALQVSEWLTQPWAVTKDNPLGIFGTALKAGGAAVNELGRTAQNIYENVAGSYGLKTGAVDRELARQIPIIGAGKAVALATGATTPAAVSASFAAPITAAVFEETGGDIQAATTAGALGMILPGASGAGVRVGERLAASVAAKLPQAAETATLATGRVVGSQAVANSVMLAAQSPELIRLQQENPEAFKEEVIKLVAQNLAFEAVQFPANVRELAARNYIDAYMRNPEYKAHIDQIAFEASQPKPPARATPEPPVQEPIAAKPAPAPQPVEAPPEAHLPEMSGPELGIVPGVGPASQLAAGTLDLAKRGVNFYSEWLVDRVGRLGGPAAKQLSDDGKQVIALAKRHYGELTPTLDPAKRAASTLGGGTTWLSQLKPVTSKTAVANVVEAIENPKSAVPANAKDIVDLARTANLEIGKLAEQASWGGFVASGKFQRNWTSLGMEIVGQGKGHPLFDELAEGLAKANNQPVGQMQDYLLKIKGVLDGLGGDSAGMRKINQDFERKLPNIITHIKVAGAWQEVIHTHLPTYLEQSAQKSATAAAFRNVFPTKDAVSKLRTSLTAPGEVPSRNMADVDGLLRALQGLHSDSVLTRALSANLNPALMGLATANKVMGEVGGKLALSGTFITNIPETLMGATPQFFGYRNFLEGLMRVGELYPQMELAGQVNRTIRDWSFDPSSPVRSTSRIVGNGISKATGQLMLNEFQEALAASTAYVVAERIRTGQLSKWEQSMLPQTFKVMGFDKAQAGQIMAGNPELLAQFQARAATFLTGGNIALAEKSRLGGNMLFNSIFRFQSYPMTKMNQLSGVTGNWFESIRSVLDKKPGAGKDLYDSSRLLARFTFGTGMQGATTMAVLALAYGGWPEVEVRRHEAQADAVDFAKDAFISAIGGPLYLISRGVEEGGMSGVAKGITQSMFPVTMTQELLDMANRVGAYKDLDENDRAAMFLKKRVPGSRAANTGLAIFGLSNDDLAMEAALRGFYRWRRKELGTREENIRSKEKDPQAEFRVQMKKLAKEIKAGNDFGDALSAAFEEAGNAEISPKAVAQSLRGRMVLEGISGKKLTDEQLQSLEKNIGPKAMRKLEDYDMLLKTLASALGGI